MYALQLKSFLLPQFSTTVSLGHIVAYRAYFQKKKHVLI